ncbi:unnamed protein product [Rhizoctonia solani]|uniref:Uncharacterized protein n=1 Tax=Rhizoctonia solani TaxID=456999 RepID=A0A8H3B2K1_9AGAM|nr:unnamed protein product [Rhizoctonia solani]
MKLEAQIKRLQSVVDATALHPGRSSCPSATSPSLLGVFSSPVQSSSSNSEFGESSRPLDTIQRLRSDNDRLRRERDAFRIQVEALMGYVSRGCALAPAGPSSVSMNSARGGENTALVTHETETEQGYSPTSGSEMDSEDRWSEPRDPLSPSPLIQSSTYTTDEINHMLSLYGQSFAFLRHLDPHAQEASLYSIGDKPIQLPALPGPDPFGTR